MLAKLALHATVLGSLRSLQRQNVAVTTRAVLERVGDDPVFAPVLEGYLYATLHHYHPKFERLDWQATPQALLSDLANEPRASILLEGSNSSADVHLHLNCEDEIVKEKVDGKRRKVPKAGDTSQASVSASAAYFTDPAFAPAYLSLLGDLFEIISGEYGWARHGAVHHGNDFDRVRRSLFEPTYVTWANFFGRGWVARIGRERLLSAPAYHIQELPQGSIVLTVAATPLDQLEPEVQERISRVKSHLGILSPSERATPEELAAFEARQVVREQEMKQRIEEAYRQAREQAMLEMQRQAEGCVSGVRQFWGEYLDYTPQSLATVDRLIATKFDAKEEPETIATAIQAFGAYVGEVVRQALGGTWHDEGMKDQPVLVSVGRTKQRVNPFETVLRRFQTRNNSQNFTLVNWFEHVSGGSG